MELPVYRPLLILLAISVLVTMTIGWRAGSGDPILQDDIYTSGMLAKEPKIYCTNYEMRRAGEDACQIVQFLKDWDQKDDIKIKHPGAWRSLGRKCCDRFCRPDDFYTACGYKKRDEKNKLQVALKTLLRKYLDPLNDDVKQKIVVLKESVNEISGGNKITNKQKKKALRKQKKTLREQIKTLDKIKKLNYIQTHLRRLYDKTKKSSFLIITTHNFIRLHDELIPRLVKIVEKRRRFLGKLLLADEPFCDSIIEYAGKVKTALADVQEGPRKKDITPGYVEVSVPPNYQLCGKALVDSPTGECKYSVTRYDPCNPNPCWKNQDCSVAPHYDYTCACKKGFEPSKVKFEGCVSNAVLFRRDPCRFIVCVAPNTECVKHDPGAKTKHTCQCIENHVPRHNLDGCHKQTACNPNPCGEQECKVDDFGKHECYCKKRGYTIEIKRCTSYPKDGKMCVSCSSQTDGDKTECMANQDLAQHMARFPIWQEVISCVDAREKLMEI